MKNLIYTIIAATLFLGSCAKDEKQVMRTWQATSVVVDGVDSSAAYTAYPYLETYGDGGVYSYSGDPNNNKGDGDYIWSTATSIKRTGVSKQPSVELHVDKLTRKVFEYHYTLSGKEYKFKFKKY